MSGSFPSARDVSRISSQSRSTAEFARSSGKIFFCPADGGTAAHAPLVAVGHAVGIGFGDGEPCHRGEGQFFPVRAAHAVGVGGEKFDGDGKCLCIVCELLLLPVRNGSEFLDRFEFGSEFFQPLILPLDAHVRRAGKVTFLRERADELRLVELRRYHDALPLLNVRAHPRDEFCIVFQERLFHKNHRFGRAQSAPRLFAFIIHFSAENVNFSHPAARPGSRFPPRKIPPFSVPLDTPHRPMLY